MGGNHLTRESVQILPDARFYATGSRAALNATKAPTAPDAATEWSYMTADGSDDAAFMSATSPAPESHAPRVLDATGGFILDASGGYVLA